MSIKTKGRVSIFVMTILCYMMVTTTHHRALGDYILEFLGLRSWSGGYYGKHLTVFYFGVPFLISLYFVEKYAILQLRYRRRDVFLIFVICMFIYSGISKTAFSYIKGNSDGLISIGYDYGNSSLNYRAEDNKFIEFRAELQLTNYSEKKKTFILSIHNPFDRIDGIGEINFYTLDGKPAVFELDGKETKKFVLTLEDYIVRRNNNFYGGTMSGTIHEIVLTNDKGESVRIDGRKGFVVELGKD